MKLRFVLNGVREMAAIALIYGWYFTVYEAGRSPGADGPHILGTSSRLAQLLLDGEWKLFILCFSSLLGPHPPFAYLPFTLSELISPSFVATHLLGSGIVLWLCWDGIRRMKGGLLGFLFFLSSSPIWLQAETAGIDLVAAATVVQSLSHLATSEELYHRRSTILWGMWMGAAFMTKYTAPMFLWGPCILAGWWVIKWSRWDRLLFAILGFVIVALPWWSTHWKNVYGYVLASGDGSSGLLTNKALVLGPWYAWENITWYPAAIADAVGWVAFALLPPALLISSRTFSIKGTLFLGMLGGWIFLNAQSQRQDRYLIAGSALAAATVGGSWLSWPLIPYFYKQAEQTYRIYSDQGPSPAQREYGHQIDTAGTTWPVPSNAYWPIDQNPDSWGIDDALRKVRAYHGSDHGTVGFLLEEEGGAPGYGIVLQRATALGYRWHIATVMVVRPQGNQSADPNRPLASIFVGPFLLGEWPSRNFSTLLVINKRKHKDWENYITKSQFELVDSFKLPRNRTARIYKTQGSAQ